MSIDPTKIDIEFDPLRQRMVGISAHGLKPFDVPFITEIVPDLWVGGCEDGLILARIARALFEYAIEPVVEARQQAGHAITVSDVTQVLVVVAVPGFAPRPLER